MDAVLNSFLLVFVGEMGDKTQLLALILAARYRKPWTILAGILVATLFNHALATWVGTFAAAHVDPKYLKYGLAFMFFAFSIWVLFPDKEEDVQTTGRFGAFMTTVVVFFLAEMGDKTQLATIALGARYSSIALVTFGSTIGMLASNALAIFLGDRFLKRVPMKWVRIAACFLFAAFGFVILAI